MAICRQVSDFETLLATKFLAWRLAIFWRLLAILVAIFGDFELVRKFMQILLHKINILILFELNFSFVFFHFLLSL